jgi:hypothetical protein
MLSLTDTVDVVEVGVLLQAVVAPSSAHKLLLEGLHNDDVALAVVLPEIRTVLDFGRSALAYVPAREGCVAFVVARTGVGAQSVLSIIRQISKVYQKTILRFHAGAIKYCLGAEEE